MGTAAAAAATLGVGNVRKGLECRWDLVMGRRTAPICVTQPAACVIII